MDIFWTILKQYFRKYLDDISTILENILTIFRQYLDNISMKLGHNFEIFVKYFKNIMVILRQYCAIHKSTIVQYMDILDIIWKTFGQYLGDIWVIFWQWLNSEWLLLEMQTDWDPFSRIKCKSSHYAVNLYWIKAHFQFEPSLAQLSLSLFFYKSLRHVSGELIQPV